MPHAIALLIACALAFPHAALAQELPATGLKICDEFLASYLTCIRQADKKADRLVARARAIEEDLRDPATRPVHENICALGLSVARNIQARGGCKSAPQM